MPAIGTDPHDASPVLGISSFTVVHAAGHGATALWDAVASGRSALRANDLDWSDRRCWIGAVPDVDAVRLPATLAPWDCRNHRLAWLALEDAAFRRAVERSIVRHGAARVGLVLGSSTSGIRSTEQAYASRRAGDAWPEGFVWRRTHALEALTGFVAQVLDVAGPRTVIATACSSSAKAFVVAQRWIDAGWIDAAIVGGVDSLCLTTLHGFDALQLLSQQPCRPFDAMRDGISLGEAAGFALLERDPAPVAFVAGGESSDAWHPTAPHPEGAGALAAMRDALERAGLAPADIGYVNAHGTATPSNDRAEAAALVAAFGERGVPVSSTKGVTGHALGAAGIVEAIVTMLALEHQALPPCANRVAPDDTLGLALVDSLRPARLRHAISDSFGFGGSNCALVFSRCD